MNFTLKKSDLNFKVYTVEARPTAPGAENDIAIISSVPMTNWLMSPEVPSGIPRNDGDVWIQYSTNGDTFNALKQNVMMIATISAWQYVDGAWVDREAVSCQGGEWVDWIPPNYLFKAGFGASVEFTVGNETNATAPVIGNKVITFTQSTGSTNGDYAYMITKEPIDVTYISVFYIRATVTANKPLRCGTSASNSSPWVAPTDGEVNMTDAGVEKVYEYHVTTISGNRYFKITGINGATITDIWWE